MTFINEFTPPEDVEKYGLKQIDKRFEFLGTVSARDWTIDRERDIYLRQVARAGGSEIETRNQLTFTFFWKSHELSMRLDLLDSCGEREAPGWSHWRLVLVWFNGGNGLPESLKPHRHEIIADLKEALIAYKDGGAYSSTTDYAVTLDIDSECEL
jgi:hypothetical protein